MTSPVGRSGAGGTFGLSNNAIAKLLQQKGVPASEILKFVQSGTITPAITRVLSPGQIAQITGGQSTSAGSSAIGGTPAMPGTYSAIQGLANGAPRIAGQATMPGQYDSVIDKLKGLATGLVGGIAKIANPAQNTAQAQAAQGIDPKKKALADQIARAVANSNRIVGAYNNAGAQALAAQQGAGMDTIGPDMGSPISTYSAPEISMRDFTGQANDLASQAYGPLYDAIQQGKVNATGQYNTSDTVVKGLYDKLVADTKASGANQAQQYDAASTEAAARAKALQDRQAQVYGDTANTQTALLERLGQQQAAPQVISGGLQEQAFQQSQAAQQGDAQQQFYQAGKQNSNDFTTGTANAQNTQGTVAREGLVRDLASVLGQYDQQTLGAKSQQATTALDLANQLSNRDLQVQTANASNQMGAAQMNQSAQTQAQQAALPGSFQDGIGMP